MSEGFAPVDEQIEILTRGVVDLTTGAELRKKLERSFATGTPLTVKVGFDPTAPDIHLGHTVLLRKMRQFEDLGHRVVFVIGDFTGMIGDPTERNKTRPPLSTEEIRANAETYKRQCFKVLDPEATEIRFNSEWLGALGSEGLVRLAAKYNVARMLERKDFKDRFTKGIQISLHEFLYPLAQAYDSVFLKADVELGGTDQLFNLNVGRDIMPGYGLEPQVVLTMPLLEGLDGVEKMSKSLGNYVGVEEVPSSMFGKVMSISDDLMWRYYLLCTSVSGEGIEQMKRLVADRTLHPKKAKQGLAMRIITDFHGEPAAKEALEEFERIHTRRELPTNIPIASVTMINTPTLLPSGTLSNAFDLPQLLRDIGLASSNSEANRKLGERAVKIDGDRPLHPIISTSQLEGTPVLQVGSRQFARIEPRQPERQPGQGGLGFSPSGNQDIDSFLQLVAIKGRTTRFARALTERTEAVSRAFANLVSRFARVSSSGVGEMHQLLEDAGVDVSDEGIERLLAVLRAGVYLRSMGVEQVRLNGVRGGLPWGTAERATRRVEFMASHSSPVEPPTAEELGAFVEAELRRFSAVVDPIHTQRCIMVIVLNRVEEYATMVHDDFHDVLANAYKGADSLPTRPTHVALVTGMQATGHPPDDAIYPLLDETAFG